MRLVLVRHAAAAPDIAVSLPGETEPPFPPAGVAVLDL